MDLGIGGLGEGVEIGVGASAAVFRARQTDLDREVAVKILTATDDAFIRRFNREAKTLGKLSEHSGIVTVYDSGVTTAGQPYLILELCHGSLLERLQHGGPLDPLTTCGLFVRVTEAVAAAHAEGIVHRDIKPANILMSPDGRAMVTDFGIATTIGIGETNSVGFTASYVAPETINGRVAGPPADVYSLGATLFHLVSGETAFTDEDRPADIVALAKRIATEPVPDLRPRGVPNEVCDLIEWAMSKDPERRPTAAELRDALTRVAAGESAFGGVMTEHVKPDDTVVAGTAVTTMANPEMVNGEPGVNGAGIAPPRPPGQTGPHPVTEDTSLFGSATDGTDPVDSAGVGSQEPGLFPPTSGLSLPTTPPPGSVGPAIDRRDMFVAEDSRLVPWLLSGVAVVAAFVVFGGAALWFLGRDDNGGDVVGGSGEDQAVSTDAQPGNSQSGSFDPAGPPELRPNLGDTRTEVATPDVAGLGEIAAIRQLTDAGLRVNVVYRENDSVSVGQVITQDPAAGSQVLDDSLVTIFVSRETEDPPAPVPEVAGLTVDEATEALDDEGLSVGERRSIFSDSVPRGIVVGTDPPVDTLVNANSSVVLFVSLGQPVVPDLIGLTEAAATAELAAVTLGVETVTGTGAGPIGTVIDSNPGPGTVVAIDSTVTITVIGTVIPTCDLDATTLVDKPQAEAEAAVAAATGCTLGPAGPAEYSTTIVVGNVIRAVIDETAVQLVVSLGPPPLGCVPADLATLVAGLPGVTRAAAVVQIEAANCTVGPDLPAEISATVEVGNVVRGEITDTTVRLVLSAQTCTVPAVVDLTVDGARVAITAAGCTGAVSAGGAAGTEKVGAVTPAAGSVIVVDAPITLTVEVTAPTVPNVVGMTQAAAEAAIAGVGLTANTVTTPLPVGSENIGRVTAQSPAGGEPGPAGGIVTITVGVAEEPVDP